MNHLARITSRFQSEKSSWDVLNNFTLFIVFSHKLAVFLNNYAFTYSKMHLDENNRIFAWCSERWIRAIVDEIWKKQQWHRSPESKRPTPASLRQHRRRLFSASRRTASHLRGQHSRTNFSHDIVREEDVRSPTKHKETPLYRMTKETTDRRRGATRRVASRRLRIFGERASLRAVFQAATTWSISRSAWKVIAETKTLAYAFRKLPAFRNNKNDSYFCFTDRTYQIIP